MKAISEGDQDQAIHYGKAIKYLIAANGFMPSELNGLFSDTVSNNMDLIHLAEKQFYESTPERQKTWFEKIKQENQE